MIMLEAAKATTETVDALRTGASAMKAMHKSTYVTSDNTMPLESIIMLLSFSWIFTNVTNSLMSKKNLPIGYINLRSLIPLSEPWIIIFLFRFSTIVLILY